MTDTTRAAAPTDATDAPGEVSLGGVLRAGGFATLGTLVGLRVLDGLDGQALGLLAPEIKASLGIGDAILGLIASLTTAVFVISAVPLGQLGDRTRRTTIAAVCAGLAAAAAAVTALVTAGWQLALARIGSGIGKSAVLPIHGSLLADRYAASGRNRVFAAHGLADPVAALLGPAVIALVASGGGEAWRRAFLVLAIPLGVLAVRALALPEPERDASPPLSTAAAAARLRSIRSFSALLVGIGVVGFSLVAVPLFFSVLLDEKYGLSIFGRGLATSLTEIGAVAGSVVGGILGDRLVRRDPARVVVLVAAATAGYGVLFSLSVAFLPGLVPVLIGVGLAKAVLYAGTVPVYALVVALAPERLRALALALLGLSVFVGGGFLGGLITGIVSDAHGPGFALAVTTAPVCVIAALLVLPARRTIAADLVATASEATRDEVDAAADAARRYAGEPVPALAVRGMSAAYGPVPVLFDVDLDVMPGEIVALLGTNGAGKSTLLRAVSGLLPATGGTVRVNGTPVTWASTADRVQLGVVQVAGGRAVFPTLSVFDNLLAGCHTFAWDRARVAARIEASLARFPTLADRADQPAGLLSGGEQQQLALAKALLLEPTVLLIDELSLGLSPIVVGELLGVVAEIADSGVGVVLVEQSVNVALASATRAVFLERGRVRFSGPAHELSDRGDLLRAVFLGSEGG